MPEFGFTKYVIGKVMPVVLVANIAAAGLSRVFYNPGEYDTAEGAAHIIETISGAYENGDYPLFDEKILVKHVLNILGKTFDEAAGSQPDSTDSFRFLDVNLRVDGDEDIIEINFANQQPISREVFDYLVKAEVNGNLSITSASISVERDRVSKSVILSDELIEELSILVNLNGLNLSGEWFAKIVDKETKNLLLLNGQPDLVNQYSRTLYLYGYDKSRKKLDYPNVGLTSYFYDEAGFNNPQLTMNHVLSDSKKEESIRLAEIIMSMKEQIERD